MAKQGRRSKAGKRVLGLAAGTAMGVLAPTGAEAAPIYFNPADIVVSRLETFGLNAVGLVNPELSSPIPDLTLRPGTLAGTDIPEPDRVYFLGLNHGATGLTRALGARTAVGPASGDFLADFALAFVDTPEPERGLAFADVPEPDRPFFLGFQVDVPGGSPHFGWLRLTLGGGLLTVHDYAIESEANAPITTPAPVPEPGTLSLLALGAAGLAALRRRRAAPPSA